MNRTEKAEWIEEMKGAGRYQKITRRLEDGENETAATNAILGILNYSWGGIIQWRRMWTDYPKFGNPIINIELVTDRVVDLKWVVPYLPRAGSISYYDNDFPRKYWNAVRGDEEE